MNHQTLSTERKADGVAREPRVPAGRRERHDPEPDLDVDGLSESIFSRLFGLFGSRRR